MDTLRPARSSLGAISNPATLSTGIVSVRSSLTDAAGGASARMRRTKPSRPRAGPKASIVTPSPSLRTRPAMPSSRARR